MGWLFKRNGLIFTQVLRVFYRRPNGANRIKKMVPKPRAEPRAEPSSTLNLALWVSLQRQVAASGGHGWNGAVQADCQTKVRLIIRWREYRALDE